MRLSLAAALRMDPSALCPKDSTKPKELIPDSEESDGIQNEIAMAIVASKFSSEASMDGSVGNSSCTEYNPKSRSSQNEVPEPKMHASFASLTQNADKKRMAEHDDSITQTSESELDPTKSFYSTAKKQNPGERLQRSRERNRIHARKTRQRKKEQMQTLQSRADELKEEQIRLKQSINEKNTASILVGLFSRDSPSESRIDDPKVEELLRRPTDEIPDASKLPELPALILPGQHNSRKLQAADPPPAPDNQDLPNDGIDYNLLGKDRSTCTPAELDQIRRERNRMHAKRTRDRKRLFMEEMSEMCKKLEEENALLSRHLDGLCGPRYHTNSPQKPCQSIISPTLSSVPSAPTPPTISTSEQTKHSASPEEYSSSAPVSEHGVTLDQIKTLLDAAGRFSSKSTSAVSASEGGSLSDQDHDDRSGCKRRRLNDSDDESSIAVTSRRNQSTKVDC